MKKDFYTEQELMTMPLAVVRGLDFETKEHEKLVQKVVDRRLQDLPPSTPIYRKDVPDIETIEQELEWQAKIDARAAKLKPRMEETPSETPPSETPGEETTTETTEPVAEPEAVAESPTDVTPSPEARVKRAYNRKK
jgi:hypothetical protein